MYQRYYFRCKVRESWATHGPKMLFDQHEDEVTEDVVVLADAVVFSIYCCCSTFWSWCYCPRTHDDCICCGVHFEYLQSCRFPKVAEFYLGPGGSENYDFEHVQVDGNKKVKVVVRLKIMERQITKQRFGVSFQSCEQSHQRNQLRSWWQLGIICRESSTCIQTLGIGTLCTTGQGKYWHNIKRVKSTKIITCFGIC